MKHCDAPFIQDAETRSMLTVNIYMNDCVVPNSNNSSESESSDCSEELSSILGTFTGGRTRFYADHDERTIIASVVPAAGKCVVFRQLPYARLLHDGEAVKSGVKYLFRTDVIYSLHAKTTADNLL
jgi:hypothetical protein